jgi:carboxyl-terminal processing protease
VVQVKDERGVVKALDDDEPGVLYRGPLIVVCNRLSASASEIFAGVITDYRRGLVVGDLTTHGKGTVQNLMDVAPNQLIRVFRPAERGKLKLTIQQFYRVNGDSTQNRGVRSDVVLPSLLDHGEFGETFLENALPFDQIAAAKYSPGVLVNSEVVAQLQRASEQRVAADPEFVKLQHAIERFLERKARKTISLNEEQARKDREAEEADSKAAAVGAPAEEEEEAGARKPDAPIFPKNAYDDELLHVSLDYAAAVKTQMAAARR